MFNSVAVGLLIFRDELRTRLREAGLGQLPLVQQATAMIAVIGAGHLHFTERKGAAPDEEAVDKMVTTVLAGAMAP